MLETDFISEHDWKRLRSAQRRKWKHAPLFNRFIDAVNKIKDRYDGRLIYNRLQDIDECTLTYHESSPFPQLFKVTPNYFYIDNYDHPDIWKVWKKCDIDKDIIRILKSFDQNKYDQPEQLFPIPDNYILFLHQHNIGSDVRRRLDLRIMVNCVEWSHQNKKNILIKEHPFTLKDTNIREAWKSLEKRGVTSHAKLVYNTYNLDHLIDNCTAAWTMTSGAGLQTILKDKPVVTFADNCDYFPLAKKADSPERAYSLSFDLPKEDEILRFLSWYYHKLLIDVNSETFENRLIDRFDKFYRHRCSFNEIF